MTTKVITKVVNNFAKAAAIARRSKFKNFAHAAATIRRTAINSIRSAPGPSPRGTPPHSHRGRRLPRAIRFEADAEGAIIGPQASKVGRAGVAHEFGGQYKKQSYPRRPFMVPALLANEDRFLAEWKDAITE